MTPGAPGEIQRADPVARRRALAAVVAVLLVVSAAVLWMGDGRDLLRAWLEGQPAQVVRRAQWLAVVSALVSVLPPLLGGLLLWRLSARVGAAERFPPPGMHVVRDVRVLEGDAARRFAALCRAAALVLFAAALVTALLFVWIALALPRAAAG